MMTYYEKKLPGDGKLLLKSNFLFKLTVPILRYYPAAIWYSPTRYRLQ